jgi:hypothetical protein
MLACGSSVSFHGANAGLLSALPSLVIRENGNAQNIRLLS